MALIKCPECSNEVSDKASSCPKCGHPLQAAASLPVGDLDALIKQTLSREGKLAAIKLYRDYNPSAGLADAKQYVERLDAGLPPGTVTKQSPQGCSPMVAFGGLFIVGIVVCAILGTLSSSSDSSGGSAPSQPPSSTPAARVSADELYSSYKDNEVSADVTYKGKVVVVSGVIRNIGKDILDSPYVVIGGGEGFLDGVQCTFARAKDSPVGQVSKGQRVTVRGRVAGKMGNVLLNECQFQ